MVAKIYCFSNLKGGVGKSTSCQNIAAAKAMEGNRCLMVDLDPQGSLTIMCNLEPFDPDIEDNNIVSIFSKKRKKTSDCIHHLDAMNVDIIPSNIELSLTSLELVSRYSREHILKNALDEVRDQYDYIFIDCPTELGLLTLNGLCAADCVFIPVRAEYICYRGLRYLLDTIDDVVNPSMGLNPDLKIVGSIVTMYESIVNDQRELLELIQGKINVVGIVKKTADVYRTVSEGIPVVQSQKSSDAAKAYMEIAKLI